MAKARVEDCRIKEPSTSIWEKEMLKEMDGERLTRGRCGLRSVRFATWIVRSRVHRIQRDVNRTRRPMRWTRDDGP
ncbi:hypothetical protein QJS10_CPB18g01004 [Acorus calamus]|uniref:Uncharacterized protein n=1 Tax=Acorus calamus TaxID=4465 RepID=A0AAV9CMR2_ACOCL|nr:hypothetical protein QJS10_CPB18g01004 [Acorus calamus]